jgi:hypothetical protein
VGKGWLAHPLWGAMNVVRPAVSLWTDIETRELISLWPTASAAQIGRRLHRPRYAVTAKATRLILRWRLARRGKAFRGVPVAKSRQADPPHDA